MTRWLNATLVAVLLMLPAQRAVAAEMAGVGDISFPTSGSSNAQRHFLRGVAILHSFGWKAGDHGVQGRANAGPGFCDGVLGRVALLQPPAHS